MEQPEPQVMIQYLALLHQQAAELAQVVAVVLARELLAEMAARVAAQQIVIVAARATPHL